MASKSLNLLLISALAAMAVGLVAYNSGVLDPYLSSGKSGTEAAVGGGQEQQENASTPAGGEGSGSAPAVAEVKPPRFDVVRVEADGNVVIAGNASANSMVDVITGTRTLGSSKAGPEGDFAVVLSDPLAPGDYTIVLRATTPENVVAMSTETAIISIPESKSGDVLAIVDEPGKPSKLITVPEGDKADGAAQAEGETEVAAAVTEPPAAMPEKAEKAESDPGKEEPVKPEDVTSENAESADNAAVADDDDGVADAPETAKEEETEVAAAQPAEEQPEAEAETDDGGAEVKAGDQAEAEAAKPDEATPAVQFNIAVEAVEIEGDHVFVAGTANPGKVVRVYANKDLIGETRSSAAGRFLVESGRGLPVGEYIIRADLLEVGSAEVIARAAVPFEREAGEAVSAVAPKDDAAAPEKAGDGETQVAKADETPAAGDQAEGKPAEAADVSSGGQQDTEAAAADTGDGAATPSEPASGSGEVGTEVAAAEPGTVADQKPDEEVAVTAPKLQSTAGSVIIRRGDTLWRISRRVYGRGIRYTTIYTANRDQIENPDRIWPGQIFELPGETQEGEKADLGAIADRKPEGN